MKKSTTEISALAENHGVKGGFDSLFILYTTIHISIVYVSYVVS